MTALGIFFPASLTPSGNPHLSPDEVECLHAEDAGMEVVPGHPDGRTNQGGADVLRDGLVVLTTYRLIWMVKRPGNLGVSGLQQSRQSHGSQDMRRDDTNSTNLPPGTSAVALPLASVSEASMARKSLTHAFASPRILLRTYLDHTGMPAIRPSDRLPNRTAVVTVVLRGKATDPDVFLKHVNELLYMKSWQHDVNFKMLLSASAHSSLSTPSHQHSHSQPYGHAGYNYTHTNPLHQQQPPQIAPGGYSQAPAASVTPGSADVAGGHVAVPRERVSPAMAGVGGLLRREQEQLQQTDRSLQEAFTDLNALMAKASDMVALAERMRASVKASKAGQGNEGSAASGDGGDGRGSDGGNSGVLAVNEEELQDLLLSIGIAAPVTKETAGASYHKQLAAQLADFLQLPLERAGGILPLTDAYCLFNRARGTELISPDDLLRACSVLDALDAPVRLRKFESGVLVVQQRSHNDEWVMQRIKELVTADGAMRSGVSIADVAQALRVTPTVAKEELLMAELKGILCRDDANDGLRFYHNFFMEVSL